MEYKEIFKNVPGYEGSYQVSNLGRVKSLKLNREKLLKLGLGGHCYFIVALCNEGKVKTINVHQLVAMAFLNHKPDCTTKVVVDHIDNNPLNNRLENLQLISARENWSKDKKGSCKYAGVSWYKRTNKWRSQIMINGKPKRLGYFNCELEAHHAYQKALSKAEICVY